MARIRARKKRKVWFLPSLSYIYKSSLTKRTRNNFAGSALKIRTPQASSQYPNAALCIVLPHRDRIL